MKVAVVQFPGSNADWDALHTVRDVLGADAWYAFHKNTSLGDADAVVIPGGFWLASFAALFLGIFIAVATSLPWCWLKGCG